MKAAGTFFAAMVFAATAIGAAAPALAGGPPNDGGGGGAAASTPGSCAGADLAVSNGPIEAASTMRRVVVSFKNVSSSQCTLVGYPDANLVTAAGGVLVHVDNRPAPASHLLHLNPGDVATADVQSYAADTTTGNDCGREGTLVVTAPRDSVAHTLPVSLPICSATISNVD
ncbi:MAG: hypothetical protein QOI33_2401 [Mycobacterium sp.]|nr:hypothetical protein [Mycobacterium sp.]